MNTALTIARRELRERSFVFAAAAGIAVLPYLIALLPGMRAMGRGEVVGATGMILAGAFALGLAIILGTSVIGRELGEGRLSFYFSKPISAASLWFGKLIAGLTAIVATFAIIGIPSFIGASDRWQKVWSSDPALFVAVLLGEAVLFFVVSHAVTTMLRSRTPLVLLDFVLLVVTLGAVWLLARPLLIGMALGLAIGLATAIAIAIVLVLAIAPVWQLSRGRTDKRRNHFELSRAVWISIAGVLLLAAAFVAWVVSVGPDDLDKDFGVQQAPAGPWFFASGEASGRGDYHPTFVVNGANGEHKRINAPFYWQVAFTSNGKAAYWMHPVNIVRANRRHSQLAYQRLDDPSAKTVATSIQGGINTRVVVSDDLTRAAVINNDLLTIHDLENDRIVGSVRIPRAGNRWEYAMFFLAPDVVRVIDRSQRTSMGSPINVRIFEFDAKRRSMTQTGDATFVTRNLQIEANQDGSRLLVRMYPVKQAAIIDGRTAATILEVPAGALGNWPQFLSDNSIAAFTAEGDAVRFRVMSPAGAVTTDMKIPGYKRGHAVREIAPGKVVVSLSMPGWKTVVIDTKRGAIEHSADALRIMTEHDFGTDPRAPAIDPAQAILGMDANGSIVRWNPATGERAVVVNRG